MPMLPKGYKRPSSSSYLKFAAGNNVFRILAPPIMGWEGWTTADGKRKPVRRRRIEDFKINDTEPNKKLKHFWAMPVWNYDAGCVSILEITQATIQDAITALDNNAKWGDARNYDLCVVREGSTLEDTTYQVMPEPPTPLTQEAEKAWAELQGKFDIERLYDGGDPFGGQMSDDDETVPF